MFHFRSGFLFWFTFWTSVFGFPFFGFPCFFLATGAGVNIFVFCRLQRGVFSSSVSDWNIHTRMSAVNFDGCRGEYCCSALAAHCLVSSVGFFFGFVFRFPFLLSVSVFGFLFFISLIFFLCLDVGVPIKALRFFRGGCFPRSRWEDSNARERC